MNEALDDINQQLEQLLPGRVFRDEATRYLYSFDSLKVSCLPSAVIKVTAAEEVGVVLEAANHLRVGVTPRGAGSSRTAGATPVDGGWVLDLSGLKHLEIDARAGLARAEAGVVTADLQAEAEAMGWFYPPDPSSAKYSTMGGNLACNAGGLRGGKYGVTRDYVLALEGYLPTGEAVKWGRAVRKFAAGFNMRDLWIGSEGLLGVITAATLKLLPKPETTWTAMAALPGNREALEAALDLLQGGVSPSICEFLDRTAVQGAEAYAGAPVFEGAPGSALLLLEVDGSQEAVARQCQAVLNWARDSGARVQVAEHAADVERLWKVRRTCSTAMYRLADGKLNEDVVVPLGRQPELVEFAEQLSERFALPVAVFGHAADGNLHVNILYHRSSAEEVERAHAAVESLMQKVVDLGGAISGEHGIGLAKSPFFKIQHRAAEIEAMKRIKLALDPNGILNPKKVFTETRIWEHPTVEFSFPWE